MSSPDNSQGAAPAVPEQLTPEQMRQQASALIQQAQNAEQDQGVEVGPEGANPAAKKSQASKWLVNIMIIVVGAVGLAGCFWGGIDMDKYVKFASVFAYMFIPLIIAVGAGRGFKTWANSKYGASSSGNLPVDPAIGLPTTGARRRLFRK